MRKNIKLDWRSFPPSGFILLLAACGGPSGGSTASGIGGGGSGTTGFPTTPAAATSTISAANSAIANGVATATINIVINDVTNTPVPDIVPTFRASDTNSTNVYGVCSATNASGLSTCTLSSLVAEFKVLEITSPVAKAGGLAQFIAGPASAANSHIGGTSTVVADGLHSSVVSVTLKDAQNNSVIGVVPTFAATDTGATNSYSACEATDSSGVSHCTLRSLRAETKVLSIVSPVADTGDSVVFVPGAPSGVSSTIVGTGPVIANGVATASITSTLLDANNNPIVGVVPAFAATDSGNTNSYGACSVSNASGVSTCTLSSLRAETKTLKLVSPVNANGGSVTFVAGAASAAFSSLVGTGPVVANGVATSTVTILLADAQANPIAGVVPLFNASGSGNAYGVCSASSSVGISTCTMTSTLAETKTLQLLSPLALSGNNLSFIAGPASVANSNIVGTGPVAADGVALSTVTITLQDANANPVVDQVPTFSATDTGATNSYGACSASNSSGVSTCTLKSTRAEVKTLQILSPVADVGGTVTFTTGAASIANSNIVGSGPVVANGVATSLITITLLDAGANPVSGVVPTFSATDTGNSNAYGVCSATNGVGVSTCTLASTYAETKSLAIASPIADLGGTVDFTSNGLDLQVPIEMLGTAVINNTISTQIFDLSSTAFDISSFVATSNTIYFEVVYASTAAVGTIDLVDSSGLTVAGSSLVTAVNANPTRARSAALSVPSGTYRLRLANSAANTLTVFAARLIVQQDNATSTEIYIPLANGLFSTGSATLTNAIATTVNTAFTQTAIGVVGQDRFSYFKRDDSRFARIASGTPWTLDVVASNSTAAPGATQVALFNATSDQQVTGTSTTISSGVANTIVLASTAFASAAVNFSDLSNYEVKYRSSSSGNTARLHKATLRLKLSNLTRADIPWRISMANSAAATATMSHQKMLYEGVRYSNPRLYLEATGRFSVPSTGNFIEVSDSGVTDNAITGTAVSGSFLTLLGSKGRDRTSRFDPTIDNERLILQLTRTSGTLVLNSTQLIVSVDQR